MKKKDKLRILKNQIFFLENNGTRIIFTNINEWPMYTCEKPLLPGQNITINQIIRGKFEGRVVGLKRKRGIWILSVHVDKKENNNLL